MKKKHHYFIATAIFALIVLVALFLILEGEFIFHKLNKTLLVILIVMAYMAGCLWVVFHHKVKYNSNKKSCLY
ncbi:hypothetical protein KY360_04755 [Candidatus Woesearchaeota archaeon]|nr:hypothetical protein [Candidatus Woesearchaeota archaeon]